MTALKDKIAANFSNAAATYDQYAVMQEQAARSLCRRLADLKAEVPEGAILEIGCGTGALSRELARLFPDRPLTLVDLAPGMIAQNRAALLPILDRPELVDWQVRDAETMETADRFALIASCLTLQWFQDLASTLSRLTAALAPGGLLLCSYLGANSFPEWRAICQSLELPCTINPLPASHEIMAAIRALGHEASAGEETIRIPYPSVQAFFHSLKKTGTGTTAAKDRLTRSQFAHLLRAWQEQAGGAVTVTYQINTLLVRA